MQFKEMKEDCQVFYFNYPLNMMASKIPVCYKCKFCTYKRKCPTHARI